MIVVIDNATGNSRQKKFLPYLLNYLEKQGIAFQSVQNVFQLRQIPKHLIRGIILTGSALLLTEPTNIQHISANFYALQEYDCPIFGICFGFQLMTVAYGGTLKRQRFYRGPDRVSFYPQSVLGQNIGELKVMEAYQDVIDLMPEGFYVVGEDTRGHVKAIERYGPYRGAVLFHPEFNRGDINGNPILRNFLELCFSN